MICPKNVFWIAGLESHSITDVIFSGVLYETIPNNYTQLNQSLCWWIYGIQVKADSFKHNHLKKQTSNPSPDFQQQYLHVALRNLQPGFPWCGCAERTDQTVTVCWKAERRWLAVCPSSPQQPEGENQLDMDTFKSLPQLFNANEHKLILRTCIMNKTRRTWLEKAKWTLKNSYTCDLHSKKW